MSGKPGSGSRRPRSLAALIAVCFAVLLSAVPGVASAAPPSRVTPLVDCYTTNADGTYTVIFGYSNTSKTATTIAYGSQNIMYPSKFQGSQPTVFQPGTQQGVFSIVATQADVYANARWELDGRTVDQRAVSSAPLCSPSTPLPAIGNGTGLAIVLVAGGAFGVLFVRRLIRRTSAPGREATPTAP